MAATLSRFTLILVLLLAVSLAPLLPVSVDAGGASSPKPSRPRVDKVLLFAADGLRQDLVEGFVEDGDLPALAPLFNHGTVARHHGLRTQAPTNTGAGWYSLATGAWAGVHGSTNNTFHINGRPFASSTSSFTAGVLQAETIAQAAERGGKKVAQIEWAGGRVGTIQGPTVDFRSFFSGRGVATNYIGASDNLAFIKSFGLQFDHPAGFGDIPPFPEAQLRPATGWTNVPRSY